MQEVKVLGVTWNPCSDSLGFDLSDLSVAADNLQPSKRNLVSLVGRIYNRLRFLAPVTIKFKTLFQKLCKSKLEWDCDLPEELLKEWRSLVADLKEAGPISIPRTTKLKEPHPHTPSGGFVMCLPKLMLLSFIW